MKDSIRKEYFFSHPIDKVWNAISREEELSSWFIKADFKPQKGYRYTFESDEEHGCAKITGVVKEANPYTLVYTWIVEGTEAETTVTWKLMPEGDTTKLNLEHSGISNYDGETAVEMFNSFSAGWDNCAAELLKFLNQEVHAG